MSLIRERMLFHLMPRTTTNLTLSSWARGNFAPKARFSARHAWGRLDGKNCSYDTTSTVFAWDAPTNPCLAQAGHEGSGCSSELCRLHKAPNGYRAGQKRHRINERTTILPESKRATSLQNKNKPPPSRKKSCCSCSGEVCLGTGGVASLISSH